MLTVDVNIATIYRAGIERVAAMNLPEVPGVRYVVSWQMPDGELPQALRRDDVAVSTIDAPGVSRNRNNALLHSTADICLLADDDLIYTAEQLEAVRDAFERHPEVVLATFRYDSGAPRRMKVYPADETDLTGEIPRGYSVTTVEMAFRRRQVVDAGIRFCELAGPGAPVLTAAEDEIFFTHVRRCGFNSRFFPVTICSHPGVPTGARRLSSGTVKAGGAVIWMRHPWTAWLRVPLWAWRRWRRGQFPLLPALWHLTHGALYAIRHRL